ncbi:fas-binding factor 1 homolog isoform X2 [Kryptolebias marmoratus]|nr:fas-binding factor 1 homolog isoform X2 [Kryptolebias marmoratus]
MRGGPLHPSSPADKMFSKLAEEVKKEGLDFEDSDVSVADPSDVLRNLKDMDDMEADLFPSKKKNSAAPAPAAEGLKKDSAPLKSPQTPEGTDEAAGGGKKPNAAPSSTVRSYKKFTFADNSEGEDEHLGQTSEIKGLCNPPVDPLDALLPNEAKPEPKPRQTKPEKTLPSASASPNPKNGTTKTSNKDIFTFDNDLMDALEFDQDKNNPRKKETPFWSSKEKGDVPQRPRTRISDILEGLTSPRPLERPPTGERSHEKQQQERSSSGKETALDDDLTFGSYQPTMGSVPEGRQSRRQSVRFSTEDVSISASEKKPKPAAPATSRHRNSADWLGLRTNDESDRSGGSKEGKTAAESPKVLSSPVLERKASLTGSQFASLGKDVQADSKPSKSEALKSQRKDDEEEDDWLAGALSRKKTLSVSNTETKVSILEDSLGTNSALSNQVTSYTARGKEDTHPSIRETSPAAHSTPVREERPSQVPQQRQSQGSSAAVQKQVSLAADNLQQLLLQQQMMQTQLLGLGGVVDAGVLQKHKEQHGDQQALQARIIQLEGQIKMLQLERDQSQAMLENIQQRHELDVELLENAHKARVKLLEESAAQRETRARLECEELMERLNALTRSAEQERAALQAQYHRKLAQAQQDRDREVERLRDLQRKSILEMKTDHEDQLQRLKRLKDEEIDAVTSATSQTRSLAGVIEQMEQFSSRLGELASRVESTHEHTAHGLEQGARHRDEQLQTLQDRLTQQQKATAEERAYLKEIISRMDTQLGEQQRQLEKERWKVTAEQAKAESTQRGLEDERRALTAQLALEREELERAKSVLLEEQKSVMQRCAEERRKLAAEWAHFHAEEKQRHERAEREVSSLIERREGSIISLAQEQADLKLRSAELKQKEMTVTQERDALERLRDELDREKERMSSAALRLKTRAQEVEAFSKLAAERYEAGERALQEARRVEAEHEARLRNIHSQTERLRQLEQRTLKERVRLNHLQDETEKTRQTSSLSPVPQMIPSVLPDTVTVLPSLELTTSQNIPPSSAFPNYKSMTLEASLALWKYTAEKDQEFLQEEQVFLENLKKKSYRLTD